MPSVKRETLATRGHRIAIVDGGAEVAHAYLYLLANDLHPEPAAVVENVWVDPAHRGKGHGNRLLDEIKWSATRERCYKITLEVQQEWVRDWYGRNGYRRHGEAMRMDLLTSAPLSAPASRPGTPTDRTTRSSTRGRAVPPPRP